MKIGLSGKIGSGKSTVADYLNEVYGFDIFSFAHNLKLDLINMGVPADLIRRKPWPQWLRRLAQLHGTDMRNGDKFYWVSRCMADLEEESPDAVVIDDVRFWNEAEALRERGFVLVRVVRAGCEDTGDHASEIDLDNWEDWDYEIVADDGDIVDLLAQIDNIIEQEEDN